MSADGVKFRKPVLPGDTIAAHGQLFDLRHNFMRESSPLGGLGSGVGVEDAVQPGGQHLAEPVGEFE